MKLNPQIEACIVKPIFTFGNYVVLTKSNYQALEQVIEEMIIDINTCTEKIKELSKDI